jgi:5-methylcytosine-specific restriction endonuclease McrBC regulatory subunit McrC
MSGANLQCTEGELFAADAATRLLINEAVTRLKKQLRFRSWPLTEKPGGSVSINGLVGTISLSDGRNIEITPKTTPADDWIQSVLGLLSVSDRIDAAGARKAGLAPEHDTLQSVMASIYATRLEEAVRREGPLLLLRRQNQIRSSLRGKLNASQWLRKSLTRPHLFPTETSILTTDNDFSQALAFVAELFARETRNHGVKTRLYALQKALLPGRTVLTLAPSGVEYRTLPVQWAAYEPAWSIARTVLLKKSLLAPKGRHQGISIAIEMWPLLERLLIRSLRSATQIASEEGSIHAGIAVPKRPYSRVVLSASAGSNASPRSVNPDGVLSFGGTIRATFDAKYKRRVDGADWPSRNDIYQVLTTAAAYDSPLAILVYPEQFRPVWWDVNGLKGTPVRLAAIGLGLFSFRAGSGDIARGREILSILDAPDAPPMITSGT